MSELDGAHEDKGNMLPKVNFYDCVDDELLEFAVFSKYNGSWVFCKDGLRYVS